MRYAAIAGHLISNILYLISKLGEGIKKYPIPRINQGWDTIVFHGSTLVTAKKPSLIDALTGAPV